MQASLPGAFTRSPGLFHPFAGWFFRLSLMVKHRAVDAGIQVQLLGPGPNFAFSHGAVAEWLKAPDCKSGGETHVGSNPARLTRKCEFVP